jgi:hypothetical protein
MKKIFLVFTALLAITGVFAQCNNPFYQFKKGTTIEMANYDKKDKIQGRTETEVIDFDESSNGFVATVAYKFFDKKDKLLSEGDYKLTCDNGVIKIDMSSFVPTESMAAFQNMEVEVSMDQLEYPSNMQVGQKLNDASMQLSTNNSPVPMKMVFDITDRKVEGKESITTPAGTFDCYKIGYNSHSKVMISNMNYRTVEYLSEKCGAVRTETYKSNGSMIGYTLLTKFEQ